MKNVMIILFFICSGVFAIQAQTDTNDIEKVKHFLKIDQEKFVNLSKNDTVIFEINKSIKVKDTTRLRRRVDSLLSKNYTLGEFFMILKIDRMYRDKTIELDRRKGIKNRIQLESIDDLEVIIEDLEHSNKGSSKMRIKKQKN